MFPMMAPYDNTKVTLELRDLVEAGVDIWDFDYPSYYKGEEKTAFEKKVNDHYYFRQIGQETPGRWLHYFRSRIKEIMPYYIQLYKSVDLMEAVEDPFQAYDLTETFERQTTDTGTTSGTSTGTNTSTATGTSETASNASSERSENKTSELDQERRFSNTPQGSIDNLDNYMSEAERKKDTQTDNGTGSETSEGSEKVNTSNTSEGSETMTTSNTSEGSGTERYTLTRKGNIGVQPLGQEVQALRKAFINVDMQIIHELNDLFLGVY